MHRRVPESSTRTHRRLPGTRPPERVRKHRWPRSSSAYNDDFHGWPVAPQHQQHPVRGDDPRPAARSDVWRDLPHRRRRRGPGRPAGAGRSQRPDTSRFRDRGRRRRFGVHARHPRQHPHRPLRRRARRCARQAWRPRARRSVHRLDDEGLLARPPDRVPFSPATARRRWPNPLRPGGKLKPYTDTAPPVIDDVRFYIGCRRRPLLGGSRAWRNLPPAGKPARQTRAWPSPRRRAHVRARVSDPQSFIGWFKNVPLLAAPHHPYRLGLLLHRAPQRKGRATAHGLHRRPPDPDRDRAALCARDEAGPTRRSPPATAARYPARPSTGSGSSRSLLQLDAAEERPLPARRQAWVPPGSALGPTSRSASETHPSDDELWLAGEAVRRAHPARGFFCDPRIGAREEGHRTSLSTSRRRTERLSTPLSGGTVHSEGAENVGVVDPADGRSHGYWHIIPRVGHGQQVRKHAVIGHVARAGARPLRGAHRGHYWNPFRARGADAFHDFGAPVVAGSSRNAASRRLVPSDADGRRQSDRRLDTRNPPHLRAAALGARPAGDACAGALAAADATDARAVFPWRVAADFRSGELATEFRFNEIYAGGNTPEPSERAGSGSLRLARAWDTRGHRDGRYRLDVEAADIVVPPPSPPATSSSCCSTARSRARSGRRARRAARTSPEAAARDAADLRNGCCPPPIGGGSGRCSYSNSTPPASIALPSLRSAGR